MNTSAAADDRVAVKADHGSSNTIIAKDKILSSAEDMLRSATEKLAAKGHPSTIYPPQFMPAPTCSERLPKFVMILFSLLFIAVLIWFSTRQHLSLAIVGFLTGVFPFVIIFVALCICAMYPLEYIEQLNFRAVQIINVGAVVNLLFGHSHFVSFGSHSEDLGSFAGNTILSLGTVMFSFCTFILGPWEFMAGSPLLTVGLLVRTCATYHKLLGSDSVVENLNLGACPFLFIALAFFFKKAYQLMRLPILGSDNFKFIGLALYGGSIVANTVLSIVQSKNEMSPMAYGFTVSITSMFAFFGTCVFLLDGSRMKHHCNAILEDRYPSTTYLVRYRVGFTFANFSSCIGFAVALASAIAHLYNGGDSDMAQTENFSMIVEFITSILTAVSSILLCFCSLRPSLYSAVDQNEKYAEKFIRLLMAGFILLAIGSTANGATALVLYFDPDALKISTIRSVRVIACIGSIFLVLASWPKEEAVGNVRLTGPYTWDNVYHPSNYVLLASLWFLSGSVCKLTGMDSLAWLLYSWAFTLLLLHFHMAFYVWESMNLQPSTKEINDRDTNSNETVKSEKSRFKKPDETLDVIISGGGISGLFLACNLGKKGVKVALCERRSGSITDARFAILNSASMEFMGDILDPDILLELESRALPRSTHFGSMILNGLAHPKSKVIAAANAPSRRVLMENLDKIDDWTESRTIGSRYSSQLPLRIMQSHQEEVLKMQLSRYSNVRCYEGWMLTDFHIDEDSGVTAKIVEVNEDENGKTSTTTSSQCEEKCIFAKYIIGCDGPSSVVATKLQIRFDGLLNLANTKSLLVHAPGLYNHVINKLGNTHQYQIIRKNFGLAAIVAADPARDLWNFLFVFGKAKTAPPEKVCKEFLGTSRFEIKQHRSWYWNFFVARNFRKGKRAFLVGDCAHSWPPFGALGGNTAYGDAMNLGWKLALACKGQASELLLDSYAFERRQHVLQTAMYVLRATPNPALMKILTSRMFYNPLYMPVIRAGWYHHNSGTHGANHYSQSGIQLGIKQNFSPVIMREEFLQPDDPSCDYVPVFRTGARTPYLPFTDGKSIFSFIDSVAYSILVIKSDWVDTAQSLASSITSRGVPVTIAVLPHFDPSSYQGNHQKIANLLMAEKLMIVRPDHIIAFRARQCSSEQPQQDLIEEAASKITGIDSQQRCLKEDFDMSADAEIVGSYHRWLTREFKYSLRPYKFRFPKAIPVDNIPKNAAIELAKAKKKKFSTTTKQGDENYENSTNVKVEEEYQLSGFEKKIGPKTSPVYALMKLAAEREARGEPVYNFAVGNPRLEPPSEIIDSMLNLCRSTGEGKISGVFKYTHPAGLIELRTYLAKEIGLWQKVPDLSYEHIVCTPGAQSAIVNVFEALLQPGDHVLVQTPYYPAYKHAADLWGAQTMEIAFKEQDFDVNLESLTDLCEAAGRKLRIIATCSPSNPSGKIMKSETLFQLAAIAKKHSLKYERDVWIFMDHTYWRLAFAKDGVPATFSLYDQTILVSSMSKDLSLAGGRFGYIVVNPFSKHSRSLSNWLANNNNKLGNISPPSMIQHALLDVYKKNGALPSLKEIYKEKVNHMHGLLLSIGLSCHKPDGAFYLFPALPSGIDDVLFANKLAELGVLVIPGTAFGAPGYMRIAALPSLEEMDVALDLIGYVLKECRG